jgi:hypothetical protein
MRRVYAGFTGLGLLGLIVSLGAPWWVVSLESGAQVPIQGLTASPLASSLLAVAGAAFGLGCLGGFFDPVIALLGSSEEK